MLSGCLAMLMILLCFGFTGKCDTWEIEESAGQETSLTAIIISDLHYTHSEHPKDVVVPLMAFADEAADAIMKEVIDKKPDVFILTGDNTNSGSQTDVDYLVQKLREVRDAGIQLILTTGNHDFNYSDAEDFEAQYFPLLEPVERDPASLSYVAMARDVVFFAMDDNAVHPGGKGEFSQETMRWLEEMLERYQDKPKIFLSHHNVLVGKGSKSSDSYRIQNDFLPELLKKNGVRLIFTGHLHSQMIEEENGMYEVVSSMPYSGFHQYGFLSVSGNQADYHTRILDFETYGSSELVRGIREKEEQNGNRLADSFRGIIQGQGYPAEKTEAILELATRFIAYYEEGSLGSHLEEIKEDPSCEDMITAFWDHNYGPWMKSVLEREVRDATSLQLQLYEKNSLND